MEGKSQMTEILSKVAEFGSNSNSEMNAQVAAARKLRKELEDLTDQQKEALADGDSSSYVSISKKIEDKRLLLKYNEERLRQLQGKNAEKEAALVKLYNSLRFAATADILSIDRQALHAIDNLLGICEQAAAVMQAYETAVSVLNQSGLLHRLAAVEFNTEHNSLTLLSQRLKNARKSLEAEIQRG